MRSKANILKASLLQATSTFNTVSTSLGSIVRSLGMKS